MGKAIIRPSTISPGRRTRTPMQIDASTNKRVKAIRKLLLKRKVEWFELWEPDQLNNQFLKVTFTW